MIKFSATLTCQYDAPFSPFSAQDFESGLDWLQNSGFDAAELCVSDYRQVDIARIAQMLNRRQLSCSTIATGQARKREGLTLVSHDRQVVRRTQERLFQHIDAAAALRSQVTIGSLRSGGSTLSAQAYQYQFAEALAPCIELARQADVVLIIEALNRYEAPHLHSAESMTDFLRSIDNPENVGILWDVFHANIEDADFEQAIRLMGKRLRHVHFADSNRRFPGYGHLPFSTIYQALNAADFRGYISFECLNLPSAQTVIREAGAFVRRLQQAG